MRNRRSMNKPIQSPKRFDNAYRESSTNIPLACYN